MSRDMQIIEACASEMGATRAQIAKALGLRKHPALNDEIEALVAAGELEKRVGKARNKTPMFWYRAKGVFE